MQLNKSFFILLLLGLVAADAATGTQPPAAQAGAGSAAPPFKSGDTVCWIGDSITHLGRYHADIQLFYVTRFPDRDITFHNCGIGGDTAGGIMQNSPGYRFNHDILAHKPTVATIMLGMNDVNRGAYAKNAPPDATNKAAALANYEKNMCLMIEGLQAAGSRVILLRPTIYDETAVLRGQPSPHAGVNGALGACAAKMIEWSAKYHTGLVDFYDRMNAINAAEQKKDPGFTIVGEDRIHPGPVGHLVMAYAFLKDTGMTPWVSKMTVDGKDGSILESTNCTISKAAASPEKISFECLEGALPYPIPPAASKAIDLVPFMQDLNQELLTVPNLPVGTWTLAIDGQACGDFSSEQFATGVNLATITSTPQYKQAAAIMIINDRRQGLEMREIRNMARTEYGIAAKISPSADAAQVLATVQKQVDEQIAKDPQKVSPVLKSILDSTARQSAIVKEHECTVAMRTAAKPRPHTYVLTPAGAAGQ